jgi:hypothetical protein
MSDRRIPEATLAEIRARVPLREIVGRSVQLRRAGRNWSGCCPFHGERTPSFHLYPDHFHCFGCGAHGDVIAFVARAERLPWLDAARRLAAEAGVAIEGAPAPAAPWNRETAAPPAAMSPRRVVDDPARSDLPRRIWAEETRPIAPDGPVARYLAGRGLWPLPDACHAVLREARLRHMATGGALDPAMVARVDGPDGRQRALHRT